MQTYCLVDYDDIQAAREGLLQLADGAGRDEDRAARQRRDIGARYGLKRMTGNLLELYARFCVEPPRC